MTTLESSHSKLVSYAVLYYVMHTLCIEYVSINVCLYVLCCVRARSMGSVTRDTHSFPRPRVLHRCQLCIPDASCTAAAAAGSG